MYIAFEGVKGTGKSTVLKNLLPLFEKIYTDKTVSYFKPTAPIPNNFEINPDLCNDVDRMQFYAKRSNYHASLVNWQADYILSDRSIFTSLAVYWHKYKTQYQTLENFYAMIRSQEYCINIPDLVIQLDAPIDILLKRYEQRERNYGTHEETREQAELISLNYQEIREWVNSVYGEKAIQKKVNWQVVDSHKHSPQEILSKVLNNKSHNN